MKPIPVDTGSFEDIRTREPNLLYVDKTAYFHRLITDAQARNFFLARPRRFGKSLMISTLKAIFKGRRELFKGLAIDSSDYDWTPYPVIYLNFGFCASKFIEEFDLALPNTILQALKDIGYCYDSSLTAAANLGNAIDWVASTGKQTVILIDEYDDPVAKVLDDVSKAEYVRDSLSTIFRQLKDRTDKIRFLMITGVSKFTKTSIFSTISNLVDLSFNDDCAAMLGYTEEELDSYFSEYIAAHAAVMNMPVDAYRAELRRLYNGYRFWKYKGQKVYNPVSINLTMAFREPQFQFYWSATGRSSMLMNMLQRDDFLSLAPENVTNVSMADFDVSDLHNLKAIAMLYQTGYLTIKDYIPSINTFTLGVPDEEIRQDLSLLMTSQIAQQDIAWAQSLGTKLLTHDWEGFFVGLTALYAGAPYGSTEGRVHESSYTRNLIFLLKGQGIICQPEVQLADGRIDLVATHPCGIFIFELKVDKPASLAMTQIERKHYAAPYLADRCPIWFIGLSFDSKTHGLKDYCAEEYKA